MSFADVLLVEYFPEVLKVQTTLYQDGGEFDGTDLAVSVPTLMFLITIYYILFIIFVIYGHFGLITRLHDAKCVRIIRA